MKNFIKNSIPAVIGIAIGLLLYITAGWWGFLIVFPWIGGCISLGCFISAKKEGKARDLGRKITILLISPVFLIFLGLIQRENLQLEETVFYILLFISTGLFIRVLVHYAVAKVLGPLIWGRGFCGWACWTAALMEWLPIKENNTIPKKYGKIRYVVFIISLLIPIIFILLGYNWVDLHIKGSQRGILETGKLGGLLWFLVGNAIYYITAIILAFKFKKKRAFCKIVCPVSVVMKPTTHLALFRKKPSGTECIQCKRCNKNCPMDVDVMGYISKGKPVRSTECILCGICSDICPTKAVV